MRFQRARTQLSFSRQRIILAFRFWFRLPIDDVREQQEKLQSDALLQVVQHQTEAINSMINVMNGLTARLSLYEREIPRMRDLRRAFDLEQAGIKAAHTNGNGNGHGILSLPESRIVRP